MAIDKASIFAERFKTNPTILQQAVLGQGQVPNLDAFTALRALQLIKEEAAMRSAMAGQNAPPKGGPSLVQEAIQPAGLSAMPTPAQGFAPGGIVAFSGKDRDEGQLTRENDDDEDQVTGENTALTEDEAKGLGPVRTRLLNKILAGNFRLKQYASQIKDLTPEQQNEFIKNYLTKVEGGTESPYPKALEALKTRRGEIGSGDKYERAGAFFEAAAAAQQPGGALRAITSAGGVLGKGLGAIKRAQQTEQRALDRMEFDYMDAQRKEKQGNMRGALSALESYRKNQKDAVTARMQLEEAQGRANVRALQATKPPTPPRPGSGPKLAEQLAAASIAYQLNPTEENKKRLDGLTQAATIMRTSEIGGDRKLVEGAKVESRETTDLRTAFNKLAISNRKEYNRLVSEAGGNVKAAEDAYVNARLTTGAKPAAPTAPTTPAATGKFTATAGGVTYFFPTQKQADDFKKAAGVQ
jgi:hypothetical protein